MDKELTEFIDQWENDSNGVKESFLLFTQTLQELEDVVLEFQSRPGVTYSLRGTHPNLTDKPLFVMVDVIEGEPRWLSVCFYNDMVTDPKVRGDYVPGGLLGEDGLCFDLETADQESVDYLKERIVDAYNSCS